MKKEEKFHAMKLFCSEQQAGGELANAESFNPQGFFATSGAANCGIDKSYLLCIQG